jgi:hypothetical protein
MTVVQQFEFRQFLPWVGVILTVAALQAQGTILRADLQRVREKLPREIPRPAGMGRTRDDALKRVQELEGTTA